MTKFFQPNIIGDSESHSEEDNTKIRSPTGAPSDEIVVLFQNESFVSDTTSVSTSDSTTANVTARTTATVTARTTANVTANTSATANTTANTSATGNTTANVTANTSATANTTANTSATANTTANVTANTSAHTSTTSAESTVGRATSGSFFNLPEKSFAEFGYTYHDHEEHIPANKTNFMDIICKFVFERKYTSLIVKIGTKRFYVHHCVLQCYSKTFANTSTFNPIQLPEDHVTPRAFELIYDWMLGMAEPPPKDGCGVFELLKAATFLQVEQLIQQCWAFLDNRDWITEDRAFMLFLESKTCNVSSCHYELLTCISKFFLQIVASKHFVEFNINELLVLLHSNNFGVNSELETFYAIIRWLSYDWTERKNNVFILMECVQFGLVPPWMLCKLQKSKYLNVKRVVQMPLVHNLILDGVAYATSRFAFGCDSETFNEQIKKMGIKLPTGRQWIYDRNCFYHHKLHCNKLSEITYKHFYDYLRLLQTKDRNYSSEYELANVGPCKCDIQECHHDNSEEKSR